jgi:hypothetical protein
LPQARAVRSRLIVFRLQTAVLPHSFVLRFYTNSTNSLSSIFAKKPDVFPFLHVFSGKRSMFRLMAE